MSGYWRTVPRGIWTITDYNDAMQALEDVESRPWYDECRLRISVFGPDKKALIIDLDKIQETTGSEGVSKLLSLCVLSGT